MHIRLQATGGLPCVHIHGLYSIKCLSHTFSSLFIICKARQLLLFIEFDYLKMCNINKEPILMR